MCYLRAGNGDDTNSDRGLGEDVGWNLSCTEIGCRAMVSLTEEKILQKILSESLMLIVCPTFYLVSEDEDSNKIILKEKSSKVLSGTLE